MEESIRKSRILIEALPYIQAFRGKVIVAKYGGSALDNPAAMRGILQDLIFLSAVGIRAVLIHGGGPAITHRLSKAGKAASRFIEGMRVTDRKALRIVDRALEEVNGSLVAQIRTLGGLAEGLVARKRIIKAVAHPLGDKLGFVGVVKNVYAAPIRSVFVRHAIPVISPVGVGNGCLYNVNADHVASYVAAHLNAEKLVLLTNVRGIFRKLKDSRSLISTLKAKDAKRLMKRGVIHAGMIPKVRSCVDALRLGVKKTHIIEAAIPHAMLLEIFTKKGIGTEIIR